MARISENHHIDSCVILYHILGPKESKIGRDCTSYIARIGNIYKGILSIPALGEVVKRIFEDKKRNKEAFIISLCELINGKNIEICGFKENGSEYKLAPILKNFKRNRLEPIDSLILACAISHKANKLITTESSIINAEIPKEHKKTEVKHPRDVINRN